MLLGLMNNPARDPLKEIPRIAAGGFGFVDLTLEPPAARADCVDAAQIRAALEAHNLGVVGHTAYYLPFASAFPRIAAAALEEARACLAVFAAVGAKHMNVHLDYRAPGFSRETILLRNRDAFAALLASAGELGIGLMLENGGGDTAETLAPVLDALPSLGLHLDIGHANIGVRQSHTAGLLQKYGERLRHVHLSDNKGKSDDHLQIGAGTIDWKKELKTLKRSGYNGFVTLETFYGDSALLEYSRNKVQTLWDSL